MGCLQLVEFVVLSSFNFRAEQQNNEAILPWRETVTTIDIQWAVGQFIIARKPQLHLIYTENEDGSKF